MDESYKKISIQILNHIKNDDFDMDYIYDFANKILKKEIYDKPYLIEYDIIIQTLITIIEKLKSDYVNEIDEKRKKVISKKSSKVLQMLSRYKDGFSNNIDINQNEIDKLVKKYRVKLSSNEMLSFEETEELCYMYISSLVSITYLDYIIKNIIDGNYNINNNLYKRIFISKCKSVCDEQGIDANLSVKSFKQKGIKAITRYKSNSIYFNEEFIKPLNVVDNIITFNHEKRHLYQKANDKSSVTTLIQAKDELLAQILGYGYYNNNYENVSYERDAIYTSHIESIKYFTSLSLRNDKKVKSYVKSKIQEKVKLIPKDTLQRNVPHRGDEKKYENINLLFEKSIKKKKTFFKSLLEDCKSNMVLLHEYDIKGNKKDLYELLESREQYKDKDTISLYNYLLYEEEVSMEYIIRNACLLAKSKNKKYEEEVKTILKIKLVNFMMSKKQTQLVRNSENVQLKEKLTNEISLLRKRIIGQYKKDENIKLYLTKEEELSLGYGELIRLLKEPRQTLQHYEIEEKGKHI